jgi:serine/threonine protein kinase
MDADEEKLSTNLEKTHDWELKMDDLSYTIKKRGGPTDDIIMGSGGYGKVFKATLKSADGGDIVVAVKEPHDPSEIHMSRDLRKQFYREVHILFKMSHKNVVRAFGGIVTDADESCYMIVTELLKHPLDEYAKTLSPSDIKRKMEIFQDISDGVAYLHNCRVIHRDIKPKNIMVAEDGCVKLIDFGLSKIQENSKASKSTTHIVGTENYMSPEKARGEPSTSASDIYPVGLVFFGVLRPTATLPKTQAEREKLGFDLIKNATDSRTKLTCTLALQCISFEPKNRPTAATVATSLLLKHNLTVHLYFMCVYICIAICL